MRWVQAAGGSHRFGSGSFRLWLTRVAAYHAQQLEMTHISAGSCVRGAASCRVSTRGLRVAANLPWFPCCSPRPSAQGLADAFAAAMLPAQARCFAMDPCGCACERLLYFSLFLYCLTFSGFSSTQLALRRSGVTSSNNAGAAGLSCKLFGVEGLGADGGRAPQQRVTHARAGQQRRRWPQ